MSSPQATRRIDLDPAWLLKIFTVIPVILIFLAGAGTLWIYFFVQSLLPESQSSVDMPGLAADVQVVRDKNGVPGIIGSSEEDVALVLGYVMAQDRLWQMDFLRRAYQGRLAEILGSRYLAGDQFMRTMKAAMAEDRPPDKTTERQTLWLDNFVRGVNRFISTHPGKLPVEFSMLEYRPEAFTVDDVNGILMALAIESSPAFSVDPLLARLVGRLGGERGMQLVPRDPAAPVPLLLSGLKGWDPDGPLFHKIAEGLESMRAPGFRGGCAWAVSGERTREGKSLAAWSVYQTLAAPGFWYKARLVAGGLSLGGVFIPGVPVAVLGQNEHVSWGCLTTSVDDADLFVEDLDSNTPTAYWRYDHWANLKELQERFRVRGGSSGYKPVRLTREGPLVSEAANGKALALRWTGFGGLGLFPALYDLNRARVGQEINEAMNRIVAPCMTVLWAEESGRFGMRMAGRVPIRSPESDGVIPMPAWTGVHDWRGFVPYSELPSSENPSGDLALTTDGRPGGRDYPYLMSCYWDGAARGSKIETFLKQGDNLSKDTFQKILSDSFSTLAEDLTPVLIKTTEACAKKDDLQNRAVRLLSGWDFQMRADSAPAAMFGLFYNALVEDLFAGSLGEPFYGALVRTPALACRAVRKTFVDKNYSWLGDSKPEQVICQSLEKAVRRGESAMGSDPSKWKWGEVHKALFRHPITARSRFLELLYQVGPVTVSGFGDSLAYCGWSVGSGSVFEGVSAAQITEAGQPPSVFSMSPMGASGHFFSAHYKDQTQAWVTGKLFRDPVQGTDIRRSAMSTVQFKSRRLSKSAEK